MELLIIFLLVIINGVFAMSEIAVVSSRKTRLQRLADDGNARAATALELADDPNRFLSTVQVGITLVGILAGAFGGATIARQLQNTLQRSDLLQPYSNALAFGLVVLFTTYLSLVIGELVPKRLALLNPEKIAIAIAQPMRLLSVVAAPVVSLLSLSTTAILRLIGARPSDEPIITEEDIADMVIQGAEAGVFEIDEQQMVLRVFELDNLRVDEIMTPWTEIVWLDMEDPLTVNLQKVSSFRFSTYPVCKGQLDQVLGLVHIKDILQRCLKNETIRLQQMVVHPVFVPESQPVSLTLRTFKHTGSHVALVIDEHGSIDGLVTLHDVLEAIVGDVDTDAPQATQRQDGSWLIDGLMPIHELKDVLNCEDFPDEDYQTLGGFVMGTLDRIPTEADVFEWQDMRFEVVDMDGNRVDKVLVQIIKR